MAMRLELATFAFCSALSSGKPYAHPSATLCAVEASMMTVSGSVHIATASIAASSGRQRMAASAALRNSARLTGSLRSSPVREMISMSSRPASLSRTCRPVVPASPSIKTFFLLAAMMEARGLATA